MNGTNRGGAEVAERSLSFEEVVAPDFLRVSAVRSFQSKEVTP